MQSKEETLAARQRLVPRLGLAARAAPAPPRPRGALRVRLPDPARAGREAARRARRARERLHRSARLVRGLPARRGLGRPRSDLGPARGRGPHPARLHARAGERGARSPAPSTSARSTFDARDVGRAHPRVAARDQALHRRAVGARSSRLGHAVDADLSAHGRAAHHGRRADVRLRRRPRRRRVEHRPRSARPSAGSRRELLHRLRKHYGAERLRPLRPGQVVSGRAAAALGARLLLAPRRRADVERRRAVRRRERADGPRRGRRGSASSARSPSGSAWRPRTCRPATRTSGTTSGASGGCPSTSIPSTPGSRTRWSATACGACSRRGSTSRGLCPAARAATTPRRAGGPARGACETAACTSSRATPRWAFACRSTRFPGRATSDHPQVIHRDPSALWPPLPAYDALRARAEPIVLMPRPTDAAARSRARRRPAAR